MPQLLVSDKKGKVFEYSGLEATGMKAGHPFRLDPANLIKLPPGSRLFMLPHRRPVGYDPASGSYAAPDGGMNAVAAFLAPGYTTTYSSAYRETGRPAMLPLFSYAAAAFHKGDIYVAAVQVDKDKRHDCRFIDIEAVRKNTKIFRKAFPKNRLIPHLEKCSLEYGCANAQNFFLHRYEGPLPTSPSCNASCAGCISYQPSKRCPVAQPRISFVPRPEELLEVALFHIESTKEPIVSFGQGCEGEPLLREAIIEKSIRLIRRITSKGTININTNGSRPDKLSALIDAGLDSCRISLNSSRKIYYERYYKPRGYSFKDVLQSVRIAKEKKVFVSVNYLTMPGFTDSADEFAALKKLVKGYKVDMIQWRNLNYDPLRYFEELKISVKPSEMIGIREMLSLLREEFPRLRMGYFNPILRAAASPRR